MLPDFDTKLGPLESSLVIKNPLFIFMVSFHSDHLAALELCTRNSVIF